MPRIHFNQIYGVATGNARHMNTDFILYSFTSTNMNMPHIWHMNTARSREDETRNANQNANRNPELWGDFIQLQIQIHLKSQFEFVLGGTEEFKLKPYPILDLYRAIPRNMGWLPLVGSLKL